MELELQSTSKEKFRLLGIQAVVHDDGVILKRGKTRVKLNGLGSVHMLNAISDADSGNGFSVSDIKKNMPSEQWPLLGDVIDLLKDRRLITEYETRTGTDNQQGETAEDVFYWEFQTTSANVRAKISALNIPIIGFNNLSIQLVQALNSCGFDNAKIVDHPGLRAMEIRNPDQQDVQSFDDWVESDGMDDADCVVVCSDFGGLGLMREWNDFCVPEGKRFMPVVIQDYVAYVGPIVIPFQTPCYECLWNRQNSNLEKPELERDTDARAFFGQHANGSLAPHVGTAANIAANELLKFFSQALPGETIGQLIEVDLLEPSMNKRKFLKIPYCRVCGPSKKFSTLVTESNVFMPGNDQEEAHG